MKKYEPRSFDLTPQLVPPTMLKVTWTLHLISWRDHGLWRVDAFCGTGEERVGLAMGPCPGPHERSTLMQWGSAQVSRDIGRTIDYIAESPTPFPEGA